eukprot:4768587-Pleurochrysis_carterae.AAC.1
MTRGGRISSGGRSGCSNVGVRAPNAVPHSTSPSAMRACRAGTGCRGGRAGICADNQKPAFGERACVDAEMHAAAAG